MFVQKALFKECSNLEILFTLFDTLRRIIKKIAILGMDTLVLSAQIF